MVRALVHLKGLPAMSNLALFSGLLSVGYSNRQVPSNYDKQPPNIQLPKQGLPGSSGHRKIAKLAPFRQSPFINA